MTNETSRVARTTCSSRRATLLVLLGLVGMHLIRVSAPTTMSSIRIFLTTKNDIFVDSTVLHQGHNSDWKTSTETMGNKSLVERVEPNVTIQYQNGHISQQQQQQQYTPAQQCRLELEQWLNPQIDEFLQMGEAMPPLMDWVWDMGDHFVINLRFHEIFQWNNAAFLGAKWNWQDQFGSNFTIHTILGRSTKHHVKLVRVQVPSLHVTHQTERSVPVYLWASNIKVPANKTVQDWVYDLRPYLKCDRIETEIERPPPGTKIGMCVRFRGDHHLIPPFIAYHRLIGVEHFWFYVNEEFDLSDLPVAPYLTYVPYRFVWTEHKNYSRQRGDDGIERPWRLLFNGENYWQAEAMQQCLYRLKRYQLDWLMTNDVDEYLWLTNIESMGTKLGAGGNTSLLQEFLLKYEKKPNLGGLAVEGWSFGANATEMGERFELDIDYVHRANVVRGGRRKIIYRVPTATRIGVHWLYEGGMLQVLPVSEIRWNHYRRPNKGVFDKRKFPIVPDSSLPDAYRSSIVEAMKEYVYPNGSNVLFASMTSS